jgi:hypothetical protein
MWVKIPLVLLPHSGNAFGRAVGRQAVCKTAAIWQCGFDSHPGHLIGSCNGSFFQRFRMLGCQPGDRGSIPLRAAEVELLFDHYLLLIEENIIQLIISFFQ